MVCDFCKGELIAVSDNQMVCRECSLSYYVYKGELVEANRKTGAKAPEKLHSFKRVPIINHIICTLCYRCIDVCPSENLQFKNGILQIKNGCNRCLRCVEECHVKAIRL